MQVDNNKETTVERETRIRKIWEEERTFQASISNRSASIPLYFTKDHLQQMAYHTSVTHLVER